MKYSLIIPVYNRPDEVNELLESLTKQTFKNFEVVLVEDGSQVPCKEVANQFDAALEINYFFKDNSGPGLSRNYGAERATGDYIIFLDSDCVIPEHYLEEVDRALESGYRDAFGGPDKAHASFTNLQKAINYAMTSFLTTGGIRGGKKRLDVFYPRSFNMGYSKEVFKKTGGFSSMRFGEDIDMSLRILDNGFKTMLIEKAYVWHKRRTKFKRFYKQVFNSGIARINLYLRHPHSLKTVHVLPSLFLIGCLFFILAALFIHPYFIFPILLFTILVLIDSSIQNKNLVVGLMSVPASFIQLLGYGSGFLYAFWKRIILKKDEFSMYEKTFYK